METQGKHIIKELGALKWKVVSSESPKSTSYWWVKEFVTLKNGESQLVLTFLSDPQERNKSIIWAVSGGKNEPYERREAELSSILTLNKGWEKRMKIWIEELKEMLE